jgi:hypothetical protein
MSLYTPLLLDVATAAPYQGAANKGISKVEILLEKGSKVGRA